MKKQTGTESNRMVATYFVNGAIEEMAAHGFENYGEFVGYIRNQVPDAKDIEVKNRG